MISALEKVTISEFLHGCQDQAGNKENFIMCHEYYDFIEFLQNKLGFDEVYNLQEEFGGSFTRPSKD